MQTTVYNDWYVRTDGRIGPWNVSQGNPTNAQIHNATKIYNTLTSWGWSLSAIAGILGNMQHESSLDPALIQETNRWRLPNHAADLSDVPNSVMQNFYMEYYGANKKAFGIGLVQWDGKGITRQKLVGYCENNGYIWYDGDAQLSRLAYEYSNDMQFQHKQVYGVVWDWESYVTNTRTPEESARIWCDCYEISGGISERQQNARWWYDYFSGSAPVPPSPDPPTPPDPDPPDPFPVEGDWVMGEDLADWADTNINPENTGVPIPYSQMNGAEFVSEAWGYVPVVNDNQWYLPNNADAIWNDNGFYPTPDPTGVYLNDCPTIWYKDTVNHYILQNNSLPVGALIFRQENGVMVQVGIYMGNATMMTSTPQKGVYKGRFVEDYWTHFGFVCWVMPVNFFYPPTPAPLSPTEFLTIWYNTKRKDVKKNVKRSF